MSMDIVWRSEILFHRLAFRRDRNSKKLNPRFLEQVNDILADRQMRRALGFVCLEVVGKHQWITSGSKDLTTLIVAFTGAHCNRAFGSESIPSVSANQGHGRIEGLALPAAARFAAWL